MTTKHKRKKLSKDIGAIVVTKLRPIQSNIESAILARLQAVGSVNVNDADYQMGVILTIAAVVDHSLTCIEKGDDGCGSIPSVAIAQAHRAARSGVGLETMVLRYIAGHRVLGEFIQDEVDRSGLYGEGSRHLRRTQEALLEHLITVVTVEYRREYERVERSAEQRDKESVQRLLTGESADQSRLCYDFDGWHLGIIAIGAETDKVLRGLADRLGKSLMAITCDERTIWAWLGGQRRLVVTDVERLLASVEVTNVSLIIGEPGRGLDGWRLTHWQAQEALWVALRKPQRCTRYADVLLTAPCVRNDVLARSLEEIFLAPLDDARNGGYVLRETLRALFKAGHNINAAAAELDVDRGTVRNRQRMIEQRLGRPLYGCQAELEVALRLEQLGDVTSRSSHKT